MNQLEVKNMILGPGKPKVAVPIVSGIPVDIIDECEKLCALPCDMIEWRADYYLATVADHKEFFGDKNGYLDIIKILDDINYIAAGKPLIFTIRSINQGGNVALTKEQLESIYMLVSQTGLADFIDIEMVDANGLIDDLWISEQIYTAHSYGVKVILSHHDFKRMLSPTEIVNMVAKMKKLGADIPKIAAMSESKKDAENMLKVTSFLNDKHMGPMILLAMGEDGMATRVAGGRYGSCITFAAGKDCSAPGQVDASTMEAWLKSYYDR